MTILPAAGFMNDDARTQGEMKTAFEDQRQVIEDLHGVDSTKAPTGKNALVNGGFRVVQRGTSFTSTSTPANDDDTYLLDRWLLLSDGDDIVDVSQETTVVPSGAFAAIALDVETANKKFGICFIFEARDSKALAGQSVSLSFKARTTGTISIDHLRAGVVSWTSTADSVTSQLVAGGAWGAAGTNPTLATNWAFDNVPASLATLTAAFQTFKIENVSVASGANNVAVFIWADDVTTTLAEILYIADVQLELGSVASEFERRSFAAELAMSKWFFERIGAAASGDYYAMGQSVDTSNVDHLLVYEAKRVTPAITFSASADFSITSGGTTTTAGTMSAGQINPTRARVRFAKSGFTAGDPSVLRDDASGASFIDIDAEL